MPRTHLVSNRIASIGRLRHRLLRVGNSGRQEILEALQSMTVLIVLGSARMSDRSSLVCQSRRAHICSNTTDHQFSESANAGGSAAFSRCSSSRSVRSETSMGLAASWGRADFTSQIKCAKDETSLFTKRSR